MVSEQLPSPHSTGGSMLQTDVAMTMDRHPVLKELTLIAGFRVAQKCKQDFEPVTQAYSLPMLGIQAAVGTHRAWWGRGVHGSNAAQCLWPEALAVESSERNFNSVRSHPQEVDGSQG